MISVLVKELRDLLGAKLVAYLGGVKETRAVRQWAEGTRAVSGGEALHRLRVAYQAASRLAERDTADEVVQAWCQGLNPGLGDRSPARLLREGAVDEVGPQVLASARPDPQLQDDLAGIDEAAEDEVAHPTLAGGLQEPQSEPVDQDDRELQAAMRIHRLQWSMTPES